MGRDALEQTLLLLDRRIGEIAQPTENESFPAVVDSSDYILWAIKARKLLISGWGGVGEGSLLCRKANKLVTGYRSVATTNEYIQWTFKAKETLLEFCQKREEDKVFLNKVKALTIEHELITAGASPFYEGSLKETSLSS